MEHEVHVPVPPARLRAALTDPARMARAVPGLQQDAGTEPVAGRLKVRVGSHSITYRGALRVSVQDDGSYAMEGDATETRGTGSVKLALTLRVREAGDGSTVTFDGTATADGRITELAPDAVRSATTRLLDRFAENLGADVDEQQQPEQPEQPEPPPPRPSSGQRKPPSPTSPMPSKRGTTSKRPMTSTTSTTPMTSTESPRSPTPSPASGTSAAWTTRMSPRTSATAPLPRRSRARAPHDDRPQRGGGRSRASARPLRPRARPAERLVECHAPLGRSRRRAGRGVGDRGQQGAAQTPLTGRRPPS